MQQSVVVELAASDLTPGGKVLCPNPKAGMTLWNAHPRVYLDFAHGAAVAQCPYCATVYRLQGGGQARS
ncbi:MAG: zinc-finger domain-containing protein [Burkholderiaceae bacterium]|jgi:uncharacterized Zn-finger protein|nr:zinc-finger domain-containing protein [Burkholderiaceae bacterium]